MYNLYNKNSYEETTALLDGVGHALKGDLERSGWKPLQYKSLEDGRDKNWEDTLRIM